MKLIFLGPPGSGKGTYASRVGPMLGVLHISSGAIFRAEVKSGTELGKNVEKFLNNGVMVPDEIVIEVIKKRISQPDCKNGYIFDGFPRTIKQAEEWEKFEKLDFVINLILPDDVIVEKITSRRTCKNCGEVYNLADINREGIKMPPLLPKVSGKCDKCGGELMQRDDEKPETIVKRIEVYKKETEPLIEFYRSRGILLDVKVDSVPDQMVSKILKLIA